MRIAAPTNDGTTISEHFGRSAAFLVFEIENGQIKNREMRTNKDSIFTMKERAVVAQRETNDITMLEYFQPWPAARR